MKFPPHIWNLFTQHFKEEQCSRGESHLTVHVKGKHLNMLALFCGQISAHSYAIGTLQFLLRFFHFYRCSDPTELGSYASAVKCNSCHNGYVTPMNACITNSDWDCQNCKAVLSFIDAVALDNKLIEEQQRVNRQNLDNLEKFHKTYEHEYT